MKRKWNKKKDKRKLGFGIGRCQLLAKAGPLRCSVKWPQEFILQGDHFCCLSIVQTRFRTQLSHMCWSVGEQRREQKVREGTRQGRWWGLAFLGAQWNLLRRTRGFKKNWTEDYILMPQPLRPRLRACASNAGLLQELRGEAELGMWAGTNSRARHCH